MIQIHINATRVEKVSFIVATDVEEDRDLDTWRSIRPLVDQIDHKLQQAAVGEDPQNAARERDFHGPRHGEPAPRHSRPGSR